MPLHRRPVPSSGATDPPAAAGSGQKTLPEVFRHKSVNDWIYATGTRNTRSFRILFISSLSLTFPFIRYLDDFELYLSLQREEKIVLRTILSHLLKFHFERRGVKFEVRLSRVYSRMCGVWSGVEVVKRLMNGNVPLKFTSWYCNIGRTARDKCKTRITMHKWNKISLRKRIISIGDKNRE